MRAAIATAIPAAILAGTLNAKAASCQKPLPPPVPAGAVVEEIPGLAGQVDAYIAAMNQYLACLEQSDAKARDEAQRIIQQFESARKGAVTVVE